MKIGHGFSVTSEKEPQMVNSCVAASCSNTPSDCVSLCKFPSNVTLRQKWKKPVQRSRAQWKATDHSYLCSDRDTGSDHFDEGCFEVDSELVSQFGIKKRRRLKPGVVPTIFVGWRQRIYSQ